MSDSYTSPNGGSGPNNPGPTDLTDQAKQVGRDLKAKASEVADTVTRVAKDQADEIGTAAKEMVAGATERVKLAMTEQKTASADYLGTIAQAAQRAAGEFDSDVPQAAQYIRQAAGQLETVATAVRQRNMRELVNEVEDLARRQPTLFFGGAVILGFAALRFFKSSAPGSVIAKASGEAYANPGSRDFSQLR